MLGPPEGVLDGSVTVDPGIELERLVGLRIGVDPLAKLPGRRLAFPSQDRGCLRGLLDPEHDFVPWCFSMSFSDFSIRSIVFLASSNDSPEGMGPS